MTGHWCGWCLTGHHENCKPSATNGDGSLVSCHCSCEKTPRSASENPTPTEVPPDPYEFEREPRRPLSGYGPSCLCCGTPTRGGKFLPGHDSKHLSVLVEQITTGQVTLDEALDACTNDGLSDAFKGKLKRRLG